MNLESIDLGIFILFCVVFLVLGAIITRLIFSIPTILKYYKANTLLLIKIAKQQGVPEEDIQDAINIIKTKEGNFINDYSLGQIHEGKYREDIETAKKEK